MLLPLLTWSLKEATLLSSSCKCFVLPVGTHLRIFTALGVSPRLHQARSLKDSAGTTFSSKLSSYMWNRFICSALVKRKILSNHDHFYTKLSEFKFCALRIPCSLKQWAFFFYSCDIGWVPIHYLHKKVMAHFSKYWLAKILWMTVFDDDYFCRWVICCALQVLPRLWLLMLSRQLSCYTIACLTSLMRDSLPAHSPKLVLV